MRSLIRKLAGLMPDFVKNNQLIRTVYEKLIFRSRPVKTVSWAPPAIDLKLLGETGKRNLSVAIVGVGGQGTALSNGVAMIRGVQLVAVVDKNKQVMDTFRYNHGDLAEHYFSDISELKTIGKLDLICIATTAPTHVMLAEFIIENDLCHALLIEKPLAIRLSDTDNLVKLATDSTIRIAINHSRRWSRNYQGLRSLLDSGRFGRPRSAYLAFGKGGFGMLGVHFFDLFLDVFQSPFSSVVAELDSVAEENTRGEEYDDPGGRAWISFENGARAFVEFSNDLVRKEKFLVIKTESARIEVDEINEKIYITGPSGREEMEFVHPDLKGANRAVPVIYSLLSGDEPASDIEAGRQVIELLTAIHLSSERNSSRVNFPLEKDDRDFLLKTA